MWEYISLLPADVRYLPTDMLLMAMVTALAFAFLARWPRVVPWAVLLLLTEMWAIRELQAADAFFPPRALLQGPDAGLVAAIRHGLAGGLCVVLMRRFNYKPWLRVVLATLVCALAAGIMWGLAQCTIEWWLYGFARVTVRTSHGTISFLLFSMIHQLRESAFLALRVMSVALVVAVVQWLSRRRAAAYQLEAGRNA